MATAWQNYLTKLSSTRSEQPELKAMSITNRTFTEPFSVLNRKMQGILNMDNASVGAKIQAALKGQQQVQNMQEQMSDKALTMQSDRIAQQDTEIAKAQLAVDQEQEQLKAERQAKNTQILRKGLEVAGSITGLVLGHGSTSAMSLGGSIGKTASSFFGIDKSGHVTADPEQWDMDQAVAGLQETGGILARQANTKQTQSKMYWISQNSGKIAKIYENLSKSDKTGFSGTNFYNQFNMLISDPKSTYETINDFVNGYNTGNGYVPANGLSVNKIREKLYPENGTDLFIDMYRPVEDN